MPVSRPRPSVRATRRTAITAASALALAGCRWGPAEDDPGRSPEPDADSAVVQSAIEAVGLQLGLVELATIDQPKLEELVAALTQAHSTHLSLLGGTPESVTSGAGPRTWPSPARALDEVRRGEQALQSTLAALALQAQSGALARALASVSASIAQHLQALPVLSGPPS